MHVSRVYGAAAETAWHRARTPTGRGHASAAIGHCSGVTMENRRGQCDLRVARFCEITKRITFFVLHVQCSDGLRRRHSLLEDRPHCPLLVTVSKHHHQA